jgi:hypothetical protein
MTQNETENIQITESEIIEPTKRIIKPGRPFKGDDSEKVWFAGSDHVKAYFNEYYFKTKEERYKTVICEICNKSYQHATKARHVKTKNHIKKEKLISG